MTRTTPLLRLLGAGALLALAACADTTADMGAESVDKITASSMSHDMRWDHRPEADDWTVTALKALRTHGAALPDVVPHDIDTWCPGYKTASQADREAFWIGLISALAKHESTWNPAAVGGGGKWYGLVQIAPGTASGYGCAAKTGSALKDGAKNVSCAIRIMSHTVARDGVVSQGMRGVAADWGPFHSSSKRADMIAWTSAQPFCQEKPQMAEMVNPIKAIMSAKNAN